MTSVITVPILLPQAAQAVVTGDDISKEMYVDPNIQVLEGVSVQGAYTPTNPDQQYIDRARFNEAVDRGIFPQLNGLSGLINSLNYWCTFNNFSRLNQTGTGYDKSKREREYLDEIFAYTDNDFQNPEDDPELQKRWNENATDLSKDHGYSYEVINYLTRLAQYQSNSFEFSLMRKLQIGKSPQSSYRLRDYIIPRGDQLKQAYIRWDALVCLFNEFLIPRTDKGQPLFIVADRLYDVDGTITKIDPLLYSPISNYTKVGENSIYDFSCDANVCILPHQFGEKDTTGKAVDALNIKDTFNYIPNLSVFATDYLLSIYKRGEGKSYMYNNKSITPGGGNLEGRPSESELKASDRYRRIGSIFLNVNMLTEIAEKNEDNEDYTLGQYINDIWKKVNKVCPNHNFVLTDDKESNTLFIIDLPVDNTELPTDFHEFIPFSNKNILRSFDYTSNVPSALSSTIAIQSQNSRSIRDIDGVTFAAFNKAIKNRVFSLDASSEIDKTQARLRGEQSRLISRQQQLEIQLRTYQQSFFKNIKYADTEKSTIGEGNITGILKEYQKNASYMSISLTGTNSFNSVIPLEFSATLDGISGMVIGNIFKVQEDRLPLAYKNSNVGFILFNEEQSITAGGDWTTDISGKMTILPEEKIAIKGITIEIPPTKDAISQQETAIQESTPAAYGDGQATSALLDGQGTVSDIDDAELGDPVFLKRMKDNSSTRPYNVGTSKDPLTGNVTDQDSIGFAFVRVQPWVNNERFWDDWFNDNSLGAFDSWNRIGNPVSKFGSRGFAAEQLGIIKAVDPNAKHYVAPRDKDHESGGLEYVGGTAILYHANKRVQLLLPYQDLYVTQYTFFQKHLYVYFTYDSTASSHFSTTLGEDVYAIKVDNDKNPIENAKGFSNRVEFNDDVKLVVMGTDQFVLIKKEHTTDQKHKWYNIQFTKEASDRFNPGWTLGQVYVSNRYQRYIDTDGADYNMGGLTLEEYSKTNNCWMHHSILAATYESANQSFIMDEDEESNVTETVENEEATATDTTSEPAEELVENYRGYDIYLINSYYELKVDVVSIEAGDAFGSLDLIKEAIDEDLDAIEPNYE